MAILKSPSWLQDYSTTKLKGGGSKGLSSETKIPAEYLFSRTYNLFAGSSASFLLDSFEQAKRNNKENKGRTKYILFTGSLYLHILIK